MDRRSKLFRIAVVGYAVVVLAFAVFFAYMWNNERVCVTNTRETGENQQIEDYEVKEVEDASLPIGVCREYSWTLDGIHRGEEALVFYTLHQYADVSVNGETVYSSRPAEGNRIGKTIGSGWAIVPLYETDNGSRICVRIIPVYESVRDRSMSFEISSRYDIFRSQLKKNLMQLILAGTCLVVGLIIMVVQIFLIWKKRSRSWDIFFLGNSTMFIGLWKITDTPFSPFIFEQNIKALGYIIIGMLLLGMIPLALFLSGRFRDYHSGLMTALALLGSGVALSVLVLQLAGVADFKQMLPVAHLMLILLAVCLLVLAMGRIRRSPDLRTKTAFWLSLILFSGAALDLLLFYINKNSNNTGFTLLAVLIYTLGLFTVNMMETGKRAYTDTYTGLFNKSRWEVLMDSPDPITDPIGIMMLDLNHLKHVNDTMGHQAGDKMIVNFANILRNSIPPTNTICRWGGDEFAVLFVNVNLEMIEQYEWKIKKAVRQYNASGAKPALEYAVGHALSNEFPQMSRRELFQKADERMYGDKKKCHEENPIEK